MLARLVSISWPRDPPILASQSAGITGVSHRSQPKVIFNRVEFISTMFIKVFYLLILLFLKKNFILFLTFYFLPSMVLIILYDSIFLPLLAYQFYFFL